VLFAFDAFDKQCATRLAVRRDLARNDSFVRAQVISVQFPYNGDVGLTFEETAQRQCFSSLDRSVADAVDESRDRFWMKVTELLL